MTLKEELSLKKKLQEWKKDLTPEDLKSVINQIEDTVTKLIAKKILLEKE
ncbi:MAG: hypothetical protein ACFFG0_18185 [Candidatus Thorarchaeota archaeon]